MIIFGDKIKFFDKINNALWGDVHLERKLFQRIDLTLCDQQRKPNIARTV
jgi:hypothetical protein